MILTVELLLTRALTYQIREDKKGILFKWCVMNAWKVKLPPSYLLISVLQNTIDTPLHFWVFEGQKRRRCIRYCQLWSNAVPQFLFDDECIIPCIIYLRKHYLRPIGNRSHNGRWKKSVVTCFGWKVSQWWMKSRNLYENRKDCVTNRAKSDTVIIKKFFGHLDIWSDKLSAQTQGWTFRVIERQQSSARTVLGSNRPQRLICSRRRSYIPATVPRVSSAVWYFHPTVSFYVLCWSHCELY